MAKRSKFQAPRVVNDFTTVQKALRDVQESLDSISQGRAELRIHLADFNLVAGNFHRASAPAAGLQARLPKASGENLGDPVILHLEGMLGQLDVFAAPGDTVNGAASAGFDADGVVVLWSNGVDAWSGVAQLPTTSPGGAALDAEYVLGAAHASLPNGAVATDTTEINVTVAPGTTATWALIDGSVGLPRFANVAAGTFLGNVTAGAGPVTANSLATLAGGGLTYALGVMAVGAGTGITVNANDVQLSTLTADTFFGNFTAGAAVGTGRAGSSVAGAGLTYTSGGTLAVGAGTRITVNADDVQLAAGAADSFLMNATASPAVADYRAGASVAGAGLTYTTGGTLAVGAGTNVTVNANDVAVTNFPLTGMANQAAETFLGNFLVVPGPPTARAGNSVAGDGLTYTAGGTFAVGAGVGITSNANDVAINQAFSPTWTGSHSFVGTATTFNVNVDGAIGLDTASTFALVSTGSATFNFGGASSITSASSLDILTTTDLTLDANGDVIILGSGILQLGDGVIEGYLRMQGSTSSAPSVSSNEGMFWAFDPGAAATLPYFTDDANVDRQLAYAQDFVPRCASLSAIQSVTNSTAAITAASFSIPAGSLVAGTTYKLEAFATVTRGATATASNFVSNIVLNGSTYSIATTAIFTGAGTGHLVITGYLTCLSTGAAGTFVANHSQHGDIRSIAGANPTAVEAYALNAGSTNTVAAGTTQNTANALTLALTANMSVAVANLTIRWNNAAITRLF